MHSDRIRRIPAAFVATALLFVTVFSCAYTVNASEKEVYTPRFNEPSYENSSDVKYYYSDDNVFFKWGYGMPNCTAYAWGRAYEITGEEPSLCIYDASEWYEYTEDGYSRGQTPKLGAIACWTYTDRYGDECGHVAVVESIDNGVITFSNSAWGWLNFYLTTADVDDKYAGERDWNFQGYIYIDEFESAEPVAPSGYKTGCYKVVVDDYLNVRTSPSTSSSIAGHFYNDERINVTEIVEKSDRVWAYASTDSVSGWVALEFCEYVGSESVSSPQPEEYLSGDINLDGYADITDTTVLQLYLANAMTLSEVQKELADVNGNGDVDVSDVTAHQIQLAKNR